MSEKQKIEYSTMPKSVGGVMRGKFTKEEIEEKIRQQEIEKRIAWPNTENWLDASQVKEMLNITEPTLRRYVDNGLLKPIRWGGLRKFYVAEIRDFMGYNKLKNNEA
jgi:hypothetical protein